MSGVPASSHGGGASFDGSDKWAQYGGETVLTSGVQAALDWGSLISGHALLSLTSTTAPTIITAGVYAIGVSVAAPAHATGTARLIVDVDLNGIDMQEIDTRPLNATDAVNCCVTIVSYCPAGGVLRAQGLQTSGGNQTWDPSMIVQRVA